MLRPLAVPLLALGPLACTPGAEASSATESSSATSSTTGDDTEGCTGGWATGTVFVYGEGSIVDPQHPDTPLWTTPRQACELATIVDFDLAASGALYVLSTAFLHQATCEGTCPWRYWVRRQGLAGQEVWASPFDFPALEPRTLRALDDGGVVVGGVAHVGQERLPWLSRLDAAGAPLWQKTFPDPGQINAIAQGPDGDVVAVGNLHEYPADELWAVRLGSDGSQKWTFTLLDDRDDAAISVAVDALGRAWIVGGRDPSSLWMDLNYYSPDYEYSWWNIFPESFEIDVHVDTPLVALIDDEGGLLWLDEPAPPNEPWHSTTGLALDLLPGGDAIVGISWFDTAPKWIARYADDGSRVWETAVTPAGEYPGDVDLRALACDALGRTHILLREGFSYHPDTHLIQLDDAGAEISALSPATEGDQLALTPAGAPRVTRFRATDAWIDTWHYRNGR